MWGPVPKLPRIRSLRSYAITSGLAIRPERIPIIRAKPKDESKAYELATLAVAPSSERRVGQPTIKWPTPDRPQRVGCSPWRERFRVGIP